MAETEVKPPEKETVSQVRERLSSEKEEASVADPEGETCPVPSCGRVVKYLSHHINYMAGKGERAHIEFKESQVRAPEVAEKPHFSPGAGDALVAMLLAAALAKRPNLILPDGWKERAGEAHQMVLEEHVGPWIGKRSSLAYLAFVWGELLTVNLVVARMKTADSPDSETEIPEQHPAAVS